MKIFYNVSNNFIDEPHFEEVRVQEEMIVKINYSKTMYNGFFGKVKSIPIGMCARKDKKNMQESNEFLQRQKSIIPSLQGDCEERHLEDLIGLVDVTVVFGPDMSVMEEPHVISIPICKLVILSPREQIPFETILANQKHLKKKSSIDKVLDFYNKILSLKEKVQDDTKIMEISIDETRELLNRFEEIDMHEEFELGKLDECEDQPALEVSQ